MDEYESKYALTTSKGKEREASPTLEKEDVDLGNFAESMGSARMAMRALSSITTVVHS